MTYQSVQDIGHNDPGGVSATGADQMSAPLSSQKGSPATVTVVEQVYFAGAGRNARSVRSAYSFRVASDDEPYQRTARPRSDDWTALDPGWLGDWRAVSVLVLRADAGEVEVAVVQAGSTAEIDPATPAQLLLKEGEAVRLRPVVGTVPMVRPASPGGRPTYSLTAFPA